MLVYWIVYDCYALVDCKDDLLEVGIMEKHFEIPDERFGKNSLIALATVDENGIPRVWDVDAVYYKGSFYVITYALPNIIKHIKSNCNVAISGEWFSGHGIGEIPGWIKADENKFIADRLRTVFNAWYSNGHVNEDDENTVLWRLKLWTVFYFRMNIGTSFRNLLPIVDFTLPCYWQMAKLLV